MTDVQQPQEDYVRSLQREITVANEDNKRLKAALTKSIPEMDRIITENKKLRLVLEPFAQLYAKYKSCLTDGFITWNEYLTKVDWPTEDECESAAFRLSQQKENNEG